MTKKKIAIFASGSGTNAEEFFKKFTDHPYIEVKLLLSNNEHAYVLERAKSHQVKTSVFTKAELKDGTVLQSLKDYDIELIVLAGFMWLVPAEIVQAYQGWIVNIHPALLPRYGGKGMYGMKVHEAIINNQEDHSGITIHYVNEQYDEGDIIFQSTVQLSPEETAESLAEKIHELEHRFYPQVVEQLLTAQQQIK